MKILLAVPADVSDDCIHCGRCPRRVIIENDAFCRESFSGSPDFIQLVRDGSSRGPQRCDQCFHAEALWHEREKAKAGRGGGLNPGPPPSPSPPRP